ncbi:MAG: M48 family metallopeptidase [Candidatus Zixiibacteriota bacterium]
MWELIRQNQRKSLVLFIMMGLCLILLGYLVGAAFLPPDGGYIGIFLAFVIWGILSLVSYFNGDSIALSVSGAREVTRDVHPQLFNVVEEMKIAASLPAMPKIYIIDSPAPNAFATGRKPEKCAVAVTAGLLSRLTRDELQGVIAHEMSHIRNRDILFMTFAGIMLGSIVLISQIFLRGAMFGGGRSSRYRSKDSGGGQAQLIMLVVAIVVAILAPILAQLLYFAISRKREYLADASGARLTRYPEGLASALEKISQSTEDMPQVNKATAPMYIANPLKAKGKKLSDLTSTHPPISERIRILRTMSHGASLINYQEAYNKIKGREMAVIPPSGLKDAEAVPIRDGSREAVSTGRKQQRDVGDLMRAVNKYLFVSCVCGLRIKIPPDFKKKTFPCPRCSRDIQVPVAELAAVGAIADSLGKQGKASQQDMFAPEMTYHRTTTGWESFKCSCGHPIQISPAFSTSEITCSNCNRKVKIES